MKPGKWLCLLILMACSIAKLNAQEIKPDSGNFSPLKSEKSVGLEFTYNNLRVGKMSEEDFVRKKINERNKKTPGDGDRWGQEWISQRKRSFEPAFTEAFKKSSAKDSSGTPKYTLIFHTTFIEPGFSTAAILVHKNPEIAGELLLVETENKSKIIASAKITKVIGRAGSHFETGDHLDGAYARAGDALGAFILNN